MTFIITWATLWPGTDDISGRYEREFRNMGTIQEARSEWETHHTDAGIGFSSNGHEITEVLIMEKF